VDFLNLRAKGNQNLNFIVDMIKFILKMTILILKK